MRASLLCAFVSAVVSSGLVVGCGSSGSGTDSTSPAGTGGTDAGAGGSGTGGTSSAGGNGTGGTGTGGTSSAGGSSAGGTSSAGGNAAGGTSSAGGNGTGGSAATFKGGNVIVSDTTFKAAGMTFATYSAFAAFTNGAAASGASCTTTMDGPCLVVVCDTSGGTGGAGGAATTNPSAGDIHIDGGADALELHSDASGTYKTVTGMKQLFQGGETLMFTAAGGDVPAFQSSLVAPETPTISKPAIPMAGASLTIDRATDFEVDWSGATHGSVEVAITSAGGSMSGSLICQFDAAAGKGVVPAADLGKLAAGSGSFFLGGIARGTVMAGEYTVALIAQTGGTDANGASAAGLATLQ